ncbi:MAG: hypothetical protein ACPG1Z_06430, partial [Planctomycetota bacterium]
EDFRHQGRVSSTLHGTGFVGDVRQAGEESLREEYLWGCLQYRIKKYRLRETSEGAGQENE